MIPTSETTPVRLRRALGWRTARVRRRLDTALRRGERYLVRSGVMIDHLTIWADGPTPYLTVAATALGGMDGDLVQLTLGGCPLIPTAERGVWSAPLVHNPTWAGAAQPLELGWLRIKATIDGEPVRVRATCRPSVVTGGVRLLLDAQPSLLSGSRARMQVLAPQTDECRTAEERDAVVTEVMAAPHELIDTVYLETSLGRAAGYAADNPGAVAEYLSQCHPELPLVWGCRDGAALAQVPAGQRGVLIGSREWAEAITAARWIVVSDWLDPRIVKREGQRVLQTWHGTMYKTIGLSRSNCTDEQAAAARAQAAQWDLLLSQNPHSSEVLRTAYEWEHPLEAGYPRNDRLARGEVDREAARARLGLRPGQTAVLYAPTWRDAELDQSAVASPEELADQLGKDYVVLARGHNRTNHHALSHPRVIDVTRHPDLLELFVASDVLLTDYSSMMFDFALTGRPMVFLVPDLEEYETIRGTHFDLAAEAPGPVVRTLDEAVTALRDHDVLADSAAAVAAWRRRWLPWDDGHAAERAVQVLLELPVDATSEHPVAA